MQENINRSNAQQSLHIEILEKMHTLATAGFGLVAAFAWNSAIQELFAVFFPNQESLIAKFLYAIFITMVVVFVTSRLGKAIGTLKQTLREPVKKSATVSTQKS